MGMIWRRGSEEMWLSERLFGQRLFTLVVVFWVGSLLGGCGKSAQSEGGVPAPEVSTVVVSPEVVELVTELPGRVNPFRTAEIRPQVNGLIVKRAFTEGSDVRAGQLLYQIDPAPFEAALASAKAGLGKAEAQVPAIALRVQRFKELLDEKAVSQQDYDDAEASLRQARAEVEYAKALVRSAQPPSRVVSVGHR